MSQLKNTNIQEDNALQIAIDLVVRNYKLFIIGVVIAFGVAIYKNRTSLPVYKITSSILIQESKSQDNMTDVLNKKLFGKNQTLQNEMEILKSAVVVEQTVRNLDLAVGYYVKRGFQFQEAYKDLPIKVLYMQKHVQPISVKFEVSVIDAANFTIKAEAEKVNFYNFENNDFESKKENWTFQQKGKFGQLIENSDLSFIIEIEDKWKPTGNEKPVFYFDFTDIPSITDDLKGSLKLSIVDKQGSVIEMNLNSSSIQKGVEILNGIMNSYSVQNLEKKNHNASVTINFIDQQLGEISDSLTAAEQKLQNFRSSNQLLDMGQQTTGISTQYRDLENQKAELDTRKKYYDFIADYLVKNDDYSNMLLPSSVGIPDQILNNLMSQLITANSERINLIKGKQSENPRVKKLEIEMENLKRTIAENISGVRKTTEISIDQINKRIGKIEAEISNLPRTQRLLGGMERKYSYNNTVYNYLMEKRSEAKIAKASNLPDNEIIEPATGEGPISPNKSANYLIALILGLAIPYAFLWSKSILNNKIVSQDNLEQLTDVPVLGKILHNNKKTNNVMFEHPNSSIAESYRVLRTNLEYYVRGGHQKVIMVTSCIEGEGKSFNSLNIAMSYAQFSRKTILIDFDMRKSTSYFDKNGESLIGLSSYLINKATIDDIIIKSPHDHLDYIPSGPIPPNPVELIGLERTEKLIMQLKSKYDYIIIDTPPLAQVTDAYLLIDYADVKVLIARYNYTIKKVFSLIMRDLKQKNIGNFCIVLNDNRVLGDQYGYGYGYNKDKN